MGACIIYVARWSTFYTERCFWQSYCRPRTYIMYIINRELCSHFLSSFQIIYPLISALDLLPSTSLGYSITSSLMMSNGLCQVTVTSFFFTQAISSSHTSISMEPITHSCQDCFPNQCTHPWLQLVHPIFFKCLIFLPSFQPSLPATFFFPFRRKYQTSYIPWLWSWPLSPSTECRGHPHARHQDQEGIGAQGEAVVVGDATDDDGTHVEPLLLLDRPTYDDLRSIPLLIIFLGIKSKIIQPRQK
jgi:hypothetical protein